jgi:hypothetical protein
MTVPRIELWDMYGDFVAVIVPEKTGVIWSNQTAGIACQHPEMEGYLIPLPWQFMQGAEKKGKDPIEDHGFGVRGDVYDPEKVQTFLDWSGLAVYFEPLTMDAAKAFGEPFHEAWVPAMVVRETGDLPVHLEHLAGRAVVLTYNNSD